MSDYQDYLLLTEVSEFLEARGFRLGIDTVTLRNDIRKGRLKAHRPPRGRARRYLCKPEDVETYIEDWLTPKPVVFPACG